MFFNYENGNNYIRLHHNQFGYLELLHSTNNGTNWKSCAVSKSDWNKNEWYHLAAFWDNSQLKIYLNGEQIASTDIGSPVNFSATHFKVGNASGNGVNGIMDELLISTRARTPSEIYKHYKSGTQNNVENRFPIFRPEFSDCDISETGKLLAVLSGTNNNGAGVYISENDGNNWLEITPPDWSDYVQRCLMAIAPSNPSVGYVYVFSDNANYRTMMFSINLDNHTFENRSDNLPEFKGLPNPEDDGRMVTASNYNMLLSVKPDDENFVVIAGISSARSFDGFATPADSA